MRTLSRYVVGSYLRYYAAILVASMLIIAVIDMMVNFDNAIEFGDGIAGVATYLLLRLPSYYLPYVIPVGSYAAAFLCLGLPARSLEIMAVKAGGISPRRLVVPLLLASLVLSGVALLVNETIVRETANEFNRAERGGGASLHQARGAFWYHRGSTLFRVEEADRDLRTLYGVSVYERDTEGRLVRSVQAEAAHIEADHRWRLEQAVFRRFDANAPEAAPRTEIRAEAWLDLGSELDLALLDADVHSLSLPHLADYIDALDEEGRDTARFRALFHARLAEPLSVLLFALLGAPIGLGVERSRSLATAALEGIALVAVYYAVQTSTALSLSEGAMTSAAVPWAILAVFGGFGAWRMSRVAV